MTTRVTNQTRRDFLKVAAGGTAAAALGARPAAAADKTITILHESSFIKPFDEYVSNTLAPAYEKATGIKVNYEVTSVGSLPTRISTIAETGSGADVTMNGLLQVIQFSNKYLDVGDIADDIGKAQGGWYDAGREGVLVEGKWKAIPFANIGQLMNWRTDYFAEVGRQEIPGELGRAPRGRQEAEGQGSSLRFRARPRFWRQPRLALPAAVVVRRRRGGVRRQDRGDQFRRDRARRGFLPGLLQGHHARRLPWVDRRQQQQGLDGRPDLLHQQCREHPVVRQARISRDRQGHRSGDEPGRDRRGASTCST